MADNGGKLMSLVDWAKTRDPNGKAADVAEQLSQMNDVTTDALVREANQTTGHRVTVRTGLPAVAWRKLNGGITPSKSTTAQIDESCGMLEALSVVDKDVAELDGDVTATRRNEAATFLESMAQNFAYTLFYGDTSVNPERFLGLAPRFNDTSAANGVNILDGEGSSSDNASIWLHCWGQKSSFLVFPRGSKAGITQEDYGKDIAPISTGVSSDQFIAYREHFQWKVGLVLKDWRYTVRIANIDVPDLVANGNDAADLIALMSRSLDRIPTFAGVKPVFYVNRTIFSWLRIQALAKSSSALAVEPALTQFGSPVAGGMSFMGIPIRRVDQLLNSEDAVS